MVVVWYGTTHTNDGGTTIPYYRRPPTATRRAAGNICVRKNTESIEPFLEAQYIHAHTHIYSIYICVNYFTT